MNRIFREWKTAEFWAAAREGEAAIPQPIQFTEIRDKRLEAVLDKYKRQREEFPRGRSDPENLRRMRDLLGARVVVYVPSQLLLIDSAIRNSPDLVLTDDIKPRSYLPDETFERIGLDPAKFEVKGAKRSGYASLHYFVRLSKPVSGENPVFEIQTRTMLEQVWGQIEHQLGYKVGQNTEFSVGRQFRVISHHMSALDGHFDFLYDRLTYLQQRSKPIDTDLVNAENLPRLMQDHEILIRQSEIDSLLNILGTNRVRTVGALRARLVPSILNIIRDEFSHRHPGELIDAFDVIPAVAVLRPSANAERVRVAVLQTYEYGELVRRLRREIREEVRREFDGNGD